MNINVFNPFSERFLETRNKFEVDRQEQTRKNSQGYGAEEIEINEQGFNLSVNSGYGVDGGFVTTQAIFKTLFTNKQQRIQMYNDMAYYPEIMESVEVICDEAMSYNKNGDTIRLEFRNEIPAREKEYIQKTFNYLIDKVFNLRTNGWDLFRRWLIEGELFLEFVLNDKKNKIIAIKRLPAHTTYPIYENDVIVKFCQTMKAKDGKPHDTYFEADQIAYTNWGQFGRSKVDVRGYLEGSMRTYNQLKNLEDAVIVYRLVRAPERRLWNVEVGRLTTGKAEEHLKRLIAKYRKNNIYNSTTGHIDTNANIQALTEDYWFAKKEGQGTEVQMLQSGLNLGELDDVKYFLTKLYKTLKIPKSRYEDTLSNVSSNVSPGEITREEIKFSKFINRCRAHFKTIFIDALCTQLRLSNKINSRYTSKSNFDIVFEEANDFAEAKKLALMTTRLNVWSQISGDIVTKDNPEGFFSRKFAYMEILGMSEDEFNELRNQIQEQITEDSMKDGKEKDVPGEEENLTPPDIESSEPDNGNEETQMPEEDGGDEKGKENDNKDQPDVDKEIEDLKPSKEPTLPVP